MCIRDSNKPVEVSGFASLAPSSNVNRGSSKLIFDTNRGQFVINPESRQKSGVGIQAGISGYVRHAINPSSRLVFNWGVSGIRYKTSDYNSTIGNVALSYEKTLSKTRSWFMSPYYRRTWTEGSGDNTAIGLRLGGTRELGEKNRVRVSLSHERRKFPDADHNDGTVRSASVNFSRMLTPTIKVNAGLGFVQSKPEFEHSQYKTYKPFVGIVKNWENGLHTGLNLEYGKRKFAGDFPLMDFARDDSYYKVGLSLRHSKFKFFGFSPQLSCYYTKNSSNIALYEYDATDCQTLAAKSF